MSDPYAEVKVHFDKVDAVTVNSGRGSQGMKLGKKMFVMFYKGQLVAQLSPARISELIASGTGLSFDPGTGKPMADRVLIPDTNRDAWIPLCEESLQYVESGSQ